MKSLLKFVCLISILTQSCWSQSIYSLQTANNPWSKVNSPAYPILNNLYFLSTTEGWIVGDLGAILHTTDGGNNWITINTSISSNLRAVFFTNSSTGYIGGDRILLRTQDGGLSWDSTTTNFNVYDIFFKPLYTNVGYAVGPNGTILLTTDSGNSWTEQASGNQDLNRVTFNTSNTGWVTGSVFTTGGGSWYQGKEEDYSDTTFPYINGSLSETNNSGISWSVTTGINMFTDVQFINSNTGWLAASQVTSYYINFITTDSGCPAPGFCYSEGYLQFTYDINHNVLKTTNGGFTFSTSLLFSETFASTVRQVYISFPNTNIGYAVGADFNEVFKTSDGGNTWSGSTTGFDSIRIKRILFKTPQDGWLIGASGDTSLELGFILVTHDGAQSWQRQSPDGFLLSLPLNSIAFGSDGVGWMAGSGNLPLQYKSYDNGQSWYQISSAQNNGYCLLALNQNTAFIADGNVYQTLNGGQQWNSITPVDYSAGDFLVTPNVQGVILTNSSTIYTNGYIRYSMNIPYGYIYYYYAAIFKSIDMGITWTLIYKGSLYDEDNSSIFFLNESTGWATFGNIYLAGNLNNIICTQDGGSTWNTLYLPETTLNITYSDVYFTSESTGLVCNNIGELFQTTDGGSIWNVFQAVTTSLNKIYFLTPQVGWVIGNGGTMLQTRDGGQSWEYLQPVTSNNLNYITFSPNGTGFIVGDNGTMLRLNPGSVGPTSIPRKDWEIYE